MRACVCSIEAARARASLNSRTIAAYMDPCDFWRCATGRVHPDRVEGLVRKHVHHFWMKGERA